VEQISVFENALALDPQSVEAQSLLAASLVARVLNGLSDAAGEDLTRAERLVDQALAASTRYAFAHFVKARVLRAQNRWEEAVPRYETALALNRNFVGALHGLAWCKLYAGSIDEVIPLEEQAIRLSPRDPSIGYSYVMIGRVHLLQSRIDDAIVWLERGCSATPNIPFHHSWLAAAYGLKGATERAVAELAEARMRVSGDLYSSIAHVQAGGRWAWAWGSPKARALFEATYLTGLRKAGMPEE
jgi:adenylate cyclase